MCETDLHTAKERRDTSPVHWKVGQVVGYQRGGGDWGLEHTDEGVTIEGRNDLLLHQEKIIV